MIFILYVIFFFLILRFAVTLFNFISYPKLTPFPHELHDRISVLVPVRDEEENILTLLRSLALQNHPNFEVIVLDDGSTDRTAEIVQDFARSDSRFRLEKGEPLPPGWLGKNFACHQLAQKADGAYLLFLDADERVFPNLFNSAVHRMKSNKLALLSLFTNQEMRGIGERTVVPLMHFILLNLLPLRLVSLVKTPSVAAASGQFMLFDAAVYHQQQWHERVKKHVVEDIEIMRLVKQAGLRGEALLANGMISCRMYRSYASGIDGFSKNLLAGFNYSVPGLLLFLLLVLGGPVFIFISGDIELFVMAVTLILLTRLMISLSAGQNPLWNLLLHPFQMLSLALIAQQSIRRHLTRSVRWKGRNV
ncbi:MAG: glycosyltransferase [Mucilaginibacter polytrichastri]|nr:glycosyltransferase [Mucilaginibacter polytrichastri]